jgi:hypothetical protein
MQFNGHLSDGVTSLQTAHLMASPFPASIRGPNLAAQAARADCARSACHPSLFTAVLVSHVRHSARRRGRVTDGTELLVEFPLPGSEYTRSRIDRGARASASVRRREHKLRVGFTSAQGIGEQPAPHIHCTLLLGSANRTLVDAQHAAAGRGLPMVQHYIGDDLGYACLAQRGGEGSAEIVPNPARQFGA